MFIQNYIYKFYLHSNDKDTRGEIVGFVTSKIWFSFIGYWSDIVLQSKTEEAKWHTNFHVFFFFLQYAEGVILNLEAMWEESDVRTPMICFLSMGSDPTASIEALAKKQRLGKHSFHILLINHYFPFKSYLPVSLKYSELVIKKGKQWPVFCTLLRTWIQSNAHISYEACLFNKYPTVDGSDTCVQTW